MSCLLRKFYLRQLADDVAEFEDLEELEKMYKQLIQAAAELDEAAVKGKGKKQADGPNQANQPDMTGEAGEVGGADEDAETQEAAGAAEIHDIGKDEKADKADETGKVGEADQESPIKKAMVVPDQQAPVKKIIVGSARQAKKMDLETIDFEASIMKKKIYLERRATEFELVFPYSVVVPLDSTHSYWTIDIYELGYPELARNFKWEESACGPGGDDKTNTTSSGGDDWDWNQSELSFSSSIDERNGDGQEEEDRDQDDQSDSSCETLPLTEEEAASVTGRAHSGWVEADVPQQVAFEISLECFKTRLFRVHKGLKKHLDARLKKDPIPTPLEELPKPEPHNRPREPSRLREGDALGDMVWVVRGERGEQANAMSYSDRRDSFDRRIHKL